MAALLLAVIVWILSPPEADMLTSDIPSDFEGTLVSLCADSLSTDGKPCQPLDIARCWMSESGISHVALNANGWAAGIFQLMPDTARTLGWRPGDPRWTRIDEARQRYREALLAGDGAAMHAAANDVSAAQESLMREYTALSATAQLAWARLYYGSHRGSLTSPAACYTATFLPGELPHADDPAHVLCAAAGKLPEYPQGKYPGAYAANFRAFDPDGKGWITVADMTARIERVTTGPRWEEIRSRVLTAQCGTRSDLDLDSMSGVQCALAHLGYDVGPIDGTYGPRTAAALRAFQASRGLSADGQMGPLTAMALRDALTED